MGIKGKVLYNSSDVIVLNSTTWTASNLSFVRGIILMQTSVRRTAHCRHLATENGTNSFDKKEDISIQW